MNHFIYILCLLSFACQLCFAQPEESFQQLDWNSTSNLQKRNIQTQRKIGLSYIISGSLGFAGGFVGMDVAKDPLEKGAYTLFQSIGIAAIGYGLYNMQIGTEERKLYELLEQSHIKPEDKALLFQSYQRMESLRIKKENRIRAISHGMIAALNIYNASMQSPGVIRDSLYFIGVVNVLAAASFTFEF